MSTELPFEGFHELIQKPLENSDKKSLNLIKQIFIECRQPPSNPFGLLLQKFAGKTLNNKDAIINWRRILKNKSELELKLVRTVGIQTATVDFFDQNTQTTEVFSKSERNTKINSNKAVTEGWLERVYAPGYHLEKLKEEMLRAKRYKHALTVIMLDIDNFSKINESLSFKGGDKILILIVKIIKKTIRTVDILSRYSGDCFMLILPNTNKREALELADRLRQNVNQRTKRIDGLPNGVTVTISVGQCSHEESSTEFLKHLQNTLRDGKRKARNVVYAVN